MAKTIARRSEGAGWRIFGNVLSMLEDSIVRTTRRYTDRVLKRYILSSIIIILALMLVLYGAVQILNSLLPQLQSGILYVGVGITMIIAAYLYMKGE